MKIMKFGGTSIASAQAIIRTINHIKNHHSGRLVVVVSAIAEATNILTAAAKAAVNDVNLARQLIFELKIRHLEIVSELIKNPELTIQKLEHYFVELLKNIESIAVTKELSDQKLSAILAYGELLSSQMVVTAMQESGIDVVLIDARKIIITDNNYGKGTPIFDYMLKKVPDHLNTYLNQNQVVLTQGFIASTLDGSTTILGREGSDYSAAIIGMLMDADEIQIWTDVDGIMTSDPRKIANTKLIDKISFAEAAELSYFGAKVIHPLTIIPAASKNIPVKILNSINQNSHQTGTIIDHKSKATEFAIACKENIKIIKIVASDQDSCKDFEVQIDHWFKSFADEPFFYKIDDNQAVVIFNSDIDVNEIVAKLPGHLESIVADEQALISVLGEANEILKSLTVLDKNHLFSSPTALSSIIIVAKEQLWDIAQQLHDRLLCSEDSV